jgi:hypothetical protein
LTDGVIRASSFRVGIRASWAFRKIEIVGVTA